MTSIPENHVSYLKSGPSWKKPTASRDAAEICARDGNVIRSVQMMDFEGLAHEAQDLFRAA